MHLLRVMIIGTASLAIAAGAALAQRPDTRQMSCGQVQALVVDAGGIVLTTGRHTYDRYVRNSFFCDRPYAAIPASVPTVDGQCPVLRCGQPIFEDDWDW